MDATTTAHEGNRSAASEMVLHTVRTRSNTRLEPGTWVAYRWPARVLNGVIVRGCTEVERGNLDQVVNDKGNYGDASPHEQCYHIHFEDDETLDLSLPNRMRFIGSVATMQKKGKLGVWFNVLRRISPPPATR